MQGPAEKHTSQFDFSEGSFTLANPNLSAMVFPATVCGDPKTLASDVVRRAVDPLAFAGTVLCPGV